LVKLVESEKLAWQNFSSSMDDVKPRPNWIRCGDRIFPGDIDDLFVVVRTWEFNRFTGKFEMIDEYMYEEEMPGVNLCNSPSC
jgi:hypothetical protein